MGREQISRASGKPRSSLVPSFFYWINERHAIYLKKAAGKPKPWTRDPILQRYKFTNVFRQLDRGTVWLTEHVLRPHAEDGDQAGLLFNIVAYRLFNWIPTGEFLGYITRWSEEKVRAGLQARHDAGIQVFTGAHMLRGENGVSKIMSHCRVLTRFWKDRTKILRKIQEESTLQAAFRIFVTYPYIGGFLAYEFVTDLRHTPILESAPDTLSWANAGPGARRGLLRIYPDLKTQGDFLGAMQQLLRFSETRIDPHVPPLELRDIEHSLCEFDKYMRAKNGEGRPRSTYPGLSENTQRSVL